MSGDYREAKIRYTTELSIHTFVVTCPEYMLAEWKRRLTENGCVIKGVDYKHI